MQPETPRSSTACYRCYKRKVKCSREKPCRSCRLANRDCQYPVRDRNVTVSESYLRSLEARVAQGRSVEQPPHPPLTPVEGSLESRAEIPAQSVGVQLSDPLVEDPTSEVFVSGLKRLRSPTTLLGVADFSNQIAIASGPVLEGLQVQRQAYDYYQLDHDTSSTPCSFKLPPYPYALLLYERFAIFVGHDWHWFRKQTFRRRLDLTYKDPRAKELKDRIWLCRLLIVFALGESYNSESAPEVRLGRGDENTHGGADTGSDEGEGIGRRVPGTEFFEQALTLLQVRHEDPSIDQVEALNLAAFYSYSLNRKKAAYMYAGLSFRMACILKLHKPSLPSTPALEAEHRKRIWWTTYCIDRMTSTELGLPPALQVNRVEQSYPDDSALLHPSDRAEFYDAETHTTQVQLAFIHADICENMKSIRKGDTMDVDVGDLTRPILQRLEEVRAGLPVHMSFDVEDGMPPAMKGMPDRSLASLYQRYHQCFVLLLRPLFLKQISYLLAGDTIKAYQEDLRFLTNTCLRAARTNLKIITDLRSCDRMTRFGFWESLHLFSALMILSLATSVNTRWPHTFTEKPDDRNTYDTAKGLLNEMIAAGNLGSKGHGQMLAEVEAFQSGLFGGHTNGLDMASTGWDVDGWIEALLAS
ncbi:fungal-specific transcription factor domain-containing protein [Aspergillus pseudodeflectus]|uniref:Fungal-specific transcription factor domain-containing protein n=1 Tax=Aspergillus pseudodeflectus TaxID=176178 RepID=A0ABR4KWY8_9EURO